MSSAITATRCTGKTFSAKLACRRHRDIGAGADPQEDDGGRSPCARRDLHLQHLNVETVRHGPVAGVTTRRGRGAVDVSGQPVPVEGVPLIRPDPEGTPDGVDLVQVVCAVACAGAEDDIDLLRTSQGPPQVAADPCAVPTTDVREVVRVRHAVRATAEVTGEGPGSKRKARARGV